MTATRVFAVEDEAIVAMDLRARLGRLGYQVVGVAASGEQALADLERARADVVLMDIQLAGALDGVATAERVRRDLALPVIFVTAHSDAATLARARVTEPHGYVLKPFTDRELHSSIEMATFKHSAEAKLRTMERWLATTLRSIGDGVLATDLEGRVTYLNEVAERITRWPAAEAVGRPLAEVFAVRDGAAGRPTDDLVRRVLREGLVVGLGPGSVLTTRDQREVPVADSAAPIRDDQGRITGTVVCFRDVSQQVAAEAALRRTEDLLRQSQKMEALGRMSGGIAHDFNNLLTAIIGFTDVVLDRLPAGQERRHLEEVVKAGQRAAGLTQQLLAFSRKQVLEPEVLGPNSVVSDMERMLRRLIGEDVHLQTQLRATGSVKVDRTQLEQVVVNLAVNARDAMPTGGLLTIETADVDLDASYASTHVDASPGPHVELRVSDTGQGMDPETRARVFEPFFTTKGTVGTGLGLATVHGIVRQSGGHVAVESELGRGTTFQVFLPRVDAEGAPLRAAPTRAAGGTETVLVAEDEAAVRQLMCAILRPAGYRVLVAASAEEALEVAREEAGLDVLVTDMVMPGMNGRALSERLRATRPALGVLFVSGYTGASLERQGTLPPGTHFLEKPFSAEALKESVRRALDARRPAGGP